MDIKNDKYREMMDYVENLLTTNNGDHKDKPYQTFRSRIAHTKRVVKWCERLYSEYIDQSNVNEYILMSSAIFHDSGYAVSNKIGNEISHAEKSAYYFNEYCLSHAIEYKEQIENNIRFHSNKELLKIEGTPIELILLMEADLFDETGALSILFDCLSAGERQVTKYEDALIRIEEYSGKMLNYNPMVTKVSIKYWNEKQLLVENFIKSLKIDLDMQMFHI